MPSVQNFEVAPLALRGEVDEATLKHLVTIVKQAVENSSIEMTRSVIYSKLSKDHGTNLSVHSAPFGRRCRIYWIDGLKIKGLDAVLVDGKWRQVEMGVEIES